MDAPLDEIAKNLQAIEDAAKGVSDPSVQADLGQLLNSFKANLGELTSLEKEEADARAAYEAEQAAADREFLASLRAMDEEPIDEADVPSAIAEATPEVVPAVVASAQPKPAAGRDERYAFTDWVRESQSLIVPSESMAGAEAGSAVSESVVTPAEAEPVEIEKLGWSTWLQGTRGEAPAQEARPATPEDEKRDVEWRKFLESDSR